MTYNQVSTILLSIGHLMLAICAIIGIISPVVPVLTVVAAVVMFIGQALLAIAYFLQLL